MKEVTFPHDKASWDRFKAFHVFVDPNGLRGKSYEGQWLGPLVMFDTHELICTEAHPGPWKRRDYEVIGVSLTTTNEQPLYFPDTGERVTKSWLYDYGMQYLLVDHHTKQAVRLGYRSRRDSDYSAGIPTRFQDNCAGYVAGPGASPRSHNKIAVSKPVRKAGYTKDEIDHIQMIVDTGRAAMTLTDHPATRAYLWGSHGVDPDRLLKLERWDELHEDDLARLMRKGVGRRRFEYDYLLCERS